MYLRHDRPDYEFALRSADGQRARVNDQVFTTSFAVAPDQLLADWPVRDAACLVPADLDPLLALNPAVLLLGTGATQVFPSAAVMAHCLGRGIGIEVMDNASAARTYNVLASEARKVVAALVLPAA